MVMGDKTSKFEDVGDAVDTGALGGELAEARHHTVATRAKGGGLLQHLLVAQHHATASRWRCCCFLFLVV